MRAGIRLNRRHFLAASGAIATSAAFPGLSLAANPTGEPVHGLSAFGDLKYPRDFDHFDYASPDAPTGGTFNFQPGYWYYNQNTQTFNTLNGFVRRGDAPPRIEMCFDSLMASAWDEPDAVYCHLAETVTLSEDRNTFTFKLRPEARWHDGSPVTAEDVAFSYRTLTEDGNPQLSLPLAPLTEAVAEDEQTVRLTFNGSQSAQDILGIVGYPVFSSAWFAERDFTDSTLEPLLGSGPYKVGAFEAGSYIEYDRVEDYWGKDLGTARGLDLFDTIRIEFYAERQAAFEAFKKGVITFREEFTSKDWATSYDFPAVQDGSVLKGLFDKEKRPSMQAWALNQRRERFRDRRVRDAVALCFDFEWTNENIFYGIYEKSHSIFSGSPYEAEGKPGEDEQRLIDALSGEYTFPDGIEDEAFKYPTSDGSGRDRARRREASRLLTEAGWTSEGGELVTNDAGERLRVEFLIRSSAFERVYNPVIKQMRDIGIDASLRLVDPAQYQARMDTFDFDLVGMAVGWEATPPSSSIDTALGSQSADEEGSYNLPGLADPLVDALIGAVRKAETREEHRTAMLVLDRVLRLRRDWIPTYGSANHRVAYWDMFGFKEPKPDYFWPVERLWWVDTAKAKAIGKA